MRSRPFVALYVAVFVATMGISMVSPLLPVYAERLGATGIWLGLTFSVFAIVQTFVGPFAGRLSDRYGRKPFIVAGLLVYLIAALGYLTAQNFYQVIAFRAFSGLGTSLIFSVARAYVGDLTPRGQEGRWLGVFATADIVGFGTGPLVAGVLREVLGFRSVFVAMAAMMALSALVLTLWLPRHSPAELERRATRKAGGTVGRTDRTFREALGDRVVLAVTLHAGMVAVAAGATLSFLALRLEEGIGATPIMIGLAFAMQDITGGLAQPVLGRIADRRDRRLLVAGGLAAYAALLVSLGVVPSYGAAVAVLLGMGATSSLSMVAAGAIQVVAGRRAGMGTVLGLSSASNGIGIVAGSLLSGVVVSLFQLEGAFFFGGAVMAAGIPLFLWLTRGAVVAEPAAAEPRVPEAEAAG
jgi:MFS family permease